MLNNRIELILRNAEIRFALVFSAASAGFLFLIFIASVIVDPRGIFGTGLMRPVVITNRTEKLEKIARANPSPEIIIFGSSRVFQMDPMLIEKLTSLRAFNASVSYARPEEYLSMAKYITNDIGVTPKIFLVGFNVGEFNNDEVDAQTIMNPRLRKYLPIKKKQVLLTALRTFKDSISPTYLRDIGLTLLFSSTKYPDEQVTFDNNGYQNFDRNAPINSDRVAYTYPAVRLFSNFKQLNTDRKKYFKDFLEFCALHNIDVIAFITPMPKVALNAVREKASYDAVYNELIAFLTDPQNTKKLRYYDFSSSEKFGGIEDEGFNDSTHPSYKNLDLIIHRIFNKSGDRVTSK